MENPEEFWAPRDCLRAPIPEIFAAVELLSRAAGAHVAGDVELAKTCLRKANDPVVRSWTESLWGSSKANPDQQRYRRFRYCANAPPYLSTESRPPDRMPNQTEKAEIIRLHGRHCRFCGIPVVRPEVRRVFSALYPDEVTWGTTNPSQHAAFQCMWLQFDHVIPHCRGGDNSLKNIVITCAPCNFGRMSWTLEELGLNDPRLRSPVISQWDGLEGMLHR
jgi:hypothetical protein